MEVTPETSVGAVVAERLGRAGIRTPGNRLLLPRRDPARGGLHDLAGSFDLDRVLSELAESEARDSTIAPWCQFFFAEKNQTHNFSQ